MPTRPSKQAAVCIEAICVVVLDPPSLLHELHNKHIWHSGLSQASVFLTCEVRVVAGTKRPQPQTSLP